MLFYNKAKANIVDHVKLQPGAIMRRIKNKQNSCKTTFFSAITLIATLCGLFLVVSCGSDQSGEDKTIPQTAEEMAQQASANLGTKTDVDEFIVDFQKFADEYCSEGKKFKGAGMMEKVKLAQTMTTWGARMSEYNARIVSIEASASESVQKKLENINKQVDGCQKYWDMN